MNFLRMLARSLGIASSYVDYKGRRVEIEADVLCRLISELSGTNIDSDTPVSRLRLLFHDLKEERTRSIAPSTIVAWDGKFPRLWVWLRSEIEEIVCAVHAEGAEQPFLPEIRLDMSGKAIRTRKIGGQTYSRIGIRLDITLPFGYYRFRIKADAGDVSESLLIVSPRKLDPAPRIWGAFAPAYALRSEADTEIGTYSDLLAAASLIKENGGEFLGTLPLLPAFYEGEHMNVSPYAPVSRLFWNEIFLDLSDLPGAGGNEAVAQAADSGLIDYSRVYAHKKEHLLRAAKAFFELYPEGDEGFQNFVREKRELRDYAEFRARGSEEAYRFHLYAQYVCHLQLLKIRRAAEAGKCAHLYLDYTVGVHPAGFDACRMASLFMKGCHVGAPPDEFFRRGQNWGFEPLHPRELEKSGFSYLRRSLHHCLQYAKVIRLDHIMGFYRIYCIPDGMSAHQGTYVHYPFEGHLAVLCLETWRHEAILIGEDLGTVPEKVSQAMKDHAIHRMWVGQFNIGRHLKRSFSSIQPEMLACLNTHDMFPFASYLRMSDLEELRELNILTGEEFRNLRKERVRNICGLLETSSPFLSALDGIARSRARLALINLEDLWEETHPQNIPGTVNECPNWRRKFACTLKDLENFPGLREAARILNEQRAGRL